MVRAMFDYGWHNVGLLLAQCWVMVGATLVNYSWRTHCCFLVGAMLGHGWHNIVLWLAFNVGPTCIQRAK